MCAHFISRMQSDNLNNEQGKINFLNVEFAMQPEEGQPVMIRVPESKNEPPLETTRNADERPVSSRIEVYIVIHILSGGQTKPHTLSGESGRSTRESPTPSESAEIRRFRRFYDGGIWIRKSYGVKCALLPCPQIAGVV